MTVTDVRKDATALTMTVDSRWDAPIARVWQLWADPRKLERWWGPPTYPATVVDHDLRPGGTISYFMTGPEGDQHHGWWKIVSVDEPNSLAFEDGFADADGKPNDALPTMLATVTFAALPDGGTHMSIQTQFASREAMDQLLAMGMEEGLAESLSQIEAIVADA